jgi:hypothetical protein
MLCPLGNHIPYWLDKYFTVLYPKKISHRRGVGMGPNGKNLVFYWTCLGLLHFTNFSSALQITCQIPPTSSTQLHQKCKVGPNFNVFMKQQNRCFTNKYFELPHKFEDKLPTITTSYIKNILFYSFSHLAALLETRGKKMLTRTLATRVQDELCLTSSLVCLLCHGYTSRAAASPGLI